MTTRFAKGLAATAALVGTLAASGVARAQERRNPLEGQPPVRHLRELRVGRFYVGPYTGFSILGDYKNTILAGGKAEFYLRDWLSLGAEGALGFNFNTGLTNELAGVLPCARYSGDPMGDPGCTNGPYLQKSMGGAYNFDRQTPLVSQFYQHMNQIAWTADVHGAVTPLWGKVGIAGGIFAHYDLSLEVGLGFVDFTNGFPAGTTSMTNPDLENPQNAGLRVGPMFGIDMHFFFNDWVSLDLGLKDIIVEDNPGGFNTNHDGSVGTDDLSLQHKMFMTAGLVFYLPPSVEVTR